MSHTPPENGWTGHLRCVNPPVSNPVDDPSRRVSVLLSLAPLMDELANEPVVDSERLALLVARVGEVADAYRFGHSNITDAFQRLAAAAAWCVEGDLRRAAR